MYIWYKYLGVYSLVNTALSVLPEKNDGAESEILIQHGTIPNDFKCINPYEFIYSFGN